jgi:nicotinamidase-related amidase
MSALEPGKARISHPDPDVEDAEVFAIQVPHFEAQGWRYVEGDRETWPEEAREETRAGWVYIRNRDTGGTTFVPELTPALRERAWGEVDPQAEREAEMEEKTLAELKEEAKARNLPVSGTKDELRERIADHDAQEQTEAGDEPAPATEEEQ